MAKFQLHQIKYLSHKTITSTNLFKVSQKAMHFLVKKYKFICMLYWIVCYMK